MDERLREAHALAETLRQLADGFLDDAIETALLDDLVDSDASVSPRSSPRASAKNLQGLERRHVAVERSVLRQVADAAGSGQPFGVDIVPRDARGPLAGGQVAGQDLHGRALPGAVRSEKRDHLTRGNRKGEIADGDEWTVEPAETASLDCRRLGCQGACLPFVLPPRIVETARLISALAGPVSETTGIFSSTSRPFLSTRTAAADPIRASASRR